MSNTLTATNFNLEVDPLGDDVSGDKGVPATPNDSKSKSWWANTKLGASIQDFFTRSKKTDTDISSGQGVQDTRTEENNASRVVPITTPISASSTPVTPTPGAAPQPKQEPIAATAMLRRKLQAYDVNLAAIRAEMGRLEKFYEEDDAVVGSQPIPPINPFAADAYANFSSAIIAPATSFPLSTEISPIALSASTVHYRTNFGVPALLQITDSLYFFNVKWFYANKKYLEAYKKMRARQIDLFPDRRFNSFNATDPVSKRFYNWEKEFLKRFG